MQLLLIKLLFFFIASTASSRRLETQPTTYNVLHYGASGDGKTDDSKAFLKAWEDFCHASGSGGIPTLIVPANGKFLVTPVAFEGPCESHNVHVQIQGTIVAPANVAAYGGKTDIWLRFANVDGLIIDGGGIIDGQGSVWWNYCKDAGCRPTALHFHHCNGLQLTNIRHLNSQRNHIGLNELQEAHLSRLHIEAPSTSPNTDGVDISDSSQITIQDSIIATGDDCVAINGGSSYVNITRVQCGPGHGISVGSLGISGRVHESVEEIHVQDCNFTGATNGARIKTWAGWQGYARKITFERITLVSTMNPIIINQHYGGAATSLGTENTPAGEISDITYSQVQGTSATTTAIDLDCFECDNIVMDHVNIVFPSPGTQTIATCKNAHGTQVSTSPSVPCLSKK